MLQHMAHHDAVEVIVLPGEWFPAQVGLAELAVNHPRSLVQVAAGMAQVPISILVRILSKFLRFLTKWIGQRGWTTMET